MAVTLARDTAAVSSWDRAALLLGGLVLILGIATFREYGVTWDEDQASHYGFLILDYYRSGFAERGALDWRDLYNYGGAFDLSAALLEPISPVGRYETRHLLNFIVGFAGIVACWRTARSIAGPRAGFLASLLLVSIPCWYGMSFNDPKDIPFAAGMAWGMAYLCRAVDEWPNIRLSTALKFGLAAGLSLGVRVGGLLLFCYAGLLGIACCLILRQPRSVFAGTARLLIPAILLAYPLMLVFWPWAQQAPLANPIRALATFSHEKVDYPTLFAGRYYPENDLPRVYLPTFVALTLPELTLALLAGYGWLLAAPGDIDPRRFLKFLLVAIAIVFPIGYAIAIHAVLFDGMRHFIFILPPIAIAAGLTADRLLDRLSRRHRSWLTSLVAVYGLGHIAIMAMLHPDEYLYYNGLTGGVAGAQGRFKIDYWANSYREAVAGLAGRLRAAYGAEFERHHFNVAVCGPSTPATYYFPPNFYEVEDRSKADFLIAFTMDDCDRSATGPIVYRVERMGALLSVVIDLRQARQTGS